MEKDMKRNLTIGFAIGFFIMLWWSRDYWEKYGIVGAFGPAFIAGLVGAFLGFIETIVQRKKQRQIEEKK